MARLPPLRSLSAQDPAPENADSDVTGYLTQAQKMAAASFQSEAAERTVRPMEQRSPAHRSAPPPPATPPPPPGLARSPTLPPVAAPPRSLQPQQLPGEFSPEQAIAEQLRDLERWIAANTRSARKDALRFWLVKGLAFVSAAAATACQALGYPRPVVVLGIVAALFIAIDAGWHGGLLHTTQRRAMEELRQLYSTIKLRWDKVRLSSPDPRSPARVSEALQILSEVHAKRDELARYLTSADPGTSTADSVSPR